MKVCIDIQSAISQRAGVGRYTKSLVEALDAQADRDELALFYFDFKRAGLAFPVQQATQRVVRWCPGRYVQKAWKTIQWPPFDWLAGHADVYHFPNFIIPPLTRGRALVTIHDVSFLRFPEAAEPANLRYLTSCIRKTVQRADLIITDSQFSADEMVELLGVESDRVRAIHLGLTANMRAPAPEAVASFRQSARLERPYLLFVGTLEPRKNIPFLIDIFERLERFDGDLVIAGMRGWKYEPILERIAHSPHVNRIRYMEYVPEAQLPALYAGASCFVFPSRYEGFGFPPLEAMCCGTPVCASRAGSLPEVLGTAACSLDIDAADACAATVQDVLDDTTRQQTLREAGFRQAATFNWTETAQRTWALYREVNT